MTSKSTKVARGSKGDANLLKPTLMCAVPLILERIYKSIVDTMRRQGWAVEELFHYFVQYKMKWQDRGFDTPLLNKTLFRKIRYFLGGRVRLMLSGKAIFLVGSLTWQTPIMSLSCLTDAAFANQIWISSEALCFRLSKDPIYKDYLTLCTFSEQYDLAPFSNTKMSLGFEIINLVFW